MIQVANPWANTIVKNLATGNRKVASIQKGIGGQTCLQGLSKLGEYLSYVDSVDRVIGTVFFGVNDLYNPAGVGTTADNIAQKTYDRLRQLCLGLKGAMKVAIFTIPAFTPSAPWTADTLPQFRQQRDALNSLIRDNWQSFADVLVDIGSNPNLGAWGAQDNRQYFDGDSIHWNDAGHAIATSLITPKLNALI